MNIPTDSAFPSTVDSTSLQKRDSDPACDSGCCDSCSVFRAGGCMSEFLEFDYPDLNSRDNFNEKTLKVGKIRESLILLATSSMSSSD
jgi:hypothetical protein